MNCLFSFQTLLNITWNLLSNFQNKARKGSTSWGNICQSEQNFCPKILVNWRKVTLLENICYETHLLRSWLRSFWCVPEVKLCKISRRYLLTCKFAIFFINHATGTQQDFSYSLRPSNANNFMGKLKIKQN